MEKEELEIANQPGVSIIVCAHNQAENLRHYLHALSSQKYPEYEVIVVNDASEDDTQIVLEQYTQLFRNLRITFVPLPSTINLPSSNSKHQRSALLPLTLAAKAAKYDYLLLTEPDCRPETPNWISGMIRGFENPDTELVLGPSRFFSGELLFNILRLFIHPLPISNLAIRKDVFFESLRHSEHSSFRKVRVKNPDAVVWKLPFPSLSDWKLYRAAQVHF